MLSFANGSLTSAANISALTNMTIRMILKTPASITDISPILSFGGLNIFYNDYSGTNLCFANNPNGKDDDPDIWRWDVSTNTWYDFAINIATGTNSTPVVYLNGVAATITKQQNNTALDPMSTGVWEVGGATSNAGWIGHFAWWNDRLSAANMEKLTRARKADMPLFISPSTLVEYHPFDDIPVGEYTGQGTNLTPSADVTNTFSAGTYANIQSDNASYLVANAADDNETYTCELDTFTIPAGFTVYATTQWIQGKSSSETPKASITVGGVEQTQWNTGFATTDSTVSRTDYQALSQSDIDGMRLNLITPAIAKGNSISWDHCYVKISYRRHALRALKGASEFRGIASTVTSEGLAGSGFGY